MTEYKKLALRVTLDQEKILQAKASSAGYTKLAFYIRAVLFRSISTEEKIKAIYEKVCRDK